MKIKDLSVLIASPLALFASSETDRKLARDVRGVRSVNNEMTVKS